MLHTQIMQQSIRVIPTLINPPVFSKTVDIGPKNIWIHQIYKELFEKNQKNCPLGEVIENGPSTYSKESGSLFKRNLCIFLLLHTILQTILD